MKKQNVVGENIRKYRLIAGITQEELALRSALSQGYINQLENGNRNYTQKSLELIAKSLSVPVVELFKREGKEQPLKVAEKGVEYKDKRSCKKEFAVLLKDLPEWIIDHYITLMKLERELINKGLRNASKQVKQ